MDRERIKELIGECAGYVSLCWDPKPTGVFDSTAAAAQVEKTAADVLEAATAIDARTGGHRVKVTIERDVTTYSWRCEEPKTAPCHLYCECEMNAPDPNEQGICTWCEKLVKQSESCNLVTWFEEGGTGEEQYGGEPLVLLDAEFDAVWEGDYYTWKVKP